MSNDGKWDELSSQNERLIQLPPQSSSPESPTLTGLTSRSERSADAQVPLSGLASSGWPKAGLRRVASAA